MRNFYFYVKYGRALKYGGCNATARIFGLKNNKLIYLCNAEWNTCATYGEKTEIYLSLIENKYIPKKWIKNEKYFSGPVTKIYSIKEI